MSRDCLHHIIRWLFERAVSNAVLWAQLYWLQSFENFNLSTWQIEILKEKSKSDEDQNSEASKTELVLQQQDCMALVINKLFLCQNTFYKICFLRQNLCSSNSKCMYDYGRLFISNLYSMMWNSISQINCWLLISTKHWIFS